MSAVTAKIRMKLAQFRSQLTEIQREEESIEKHRSRLEQQRRAITHDIELLSEFEDEDGSGTSQTVLEGLSTPAAKDDDHFLVTLGDAVTDFIKSDTGKFTKQDLAAWVRSRYPEIEFANKSLDRHLLKARVSLPPLITVFREGGGKFPTVFERVPLSKAA